MTLILGLCWIWHYLVIFHEVEGKLRWGTRELRWGQTLFSVFAVLNAVVPWALR